MRKKKRKHTFGIQKENNTHEQQPQQQNQK